MAYTGTSVKDLSITTPTEGSSTIPEMNDAVREIKTVLKNQFAIVSKAFADTGYTALISDYIILVNANDGNVTINLPQISGVSSTAFVKEYLIIKTDSSANTVTIDGYATETINGAATKVLTTQYEACLLAGTGGTDWSSPVITKAVLAQKILVSANDTTGGYLNGKLVAGDNVTLTEGNDAGDETLTVASTQPVRDKYRALAIASASVATLTVTATDLVLQNADGGSMLASSVSETLNIGTSGANGLDTGAEGASRWYYIWVIGKADGTIDGLLSESSTAPTLPSGYTFKALVGAVYNSSGSDFVTFSQKNHRVYCANQTALNQGTESAYTAIDLSALVPSHAVAVAGYAGHTTASANSRGYISPSSTGAFGELKVMIAGTQDGALAPFVLGLITAQTMYYKTGSALTISVAGWEY